MTPISPVTWWFITAIVVTAAVIRALELGWWMFWEEKNARTTLESQPTLRAKRWGEARAVARWILHFALAILAIAGIQHWIELAPDNVPRPTGIGLWLLISVGVAVCVGFGSAAHWLKSWWSSYHGAVKRPER